MFPAESIFAPLTGRQARHGRERATKDRGRRKAAARGDLSHFHIGVLAHQAFGFLYPVPVHKKIKTAIVFRVDKLRQIGAVHGQYVLQVHQLEIRIPIRFLLFHPFFQRPAVYLAGLQLNVLLGRIIVGRLLHLLPRIPAEQNQICTVSQEEKNQPLLREPPCMGMGDAHIKVHQRNQGKHGQQLVQDAPGIHPAGR